MIDSLMERVVRQRLRDKKGQVYCAGRPLEGRGPEHGKPEGRGRQPPAWAKDHAP
jgi:hypothetical protein